MLIEVTFSSSILNTNQVCQAIKKELISVCCNSYFKTRRTGDVRPDRVWFSGFFVLNGVSISLLFILKRGIFTWINVLIKISIYVNLYELYHKPNYKFLLSFDFVDLGIDTKLNPRLITLQQILRRG